MVRDSMHRMLGRDNVPLTFATDSRSPNCLSVTLAKTT